MSFKECHSARGAFVFCPVVVLTLQKLTEGWKVKNQLATQTQGPYLLEKPLTWINKQLTESVDGKRSRTR